MTKNTWANPTQWLQNDILYYTNIYIRSSEVGNLVKRLKENNVEAYQDARLMITERQEILYFLLFADRGKLYPFLQVLQPRSRIVENIPLDEIMAFNERRETKIKANVLILVDILYRN